MNISKLLAGFFVFSQRRTRSTGRPTSVFSLNRDGSDFRMLYTFSPAGGDGRQPEAPLLEGSDGVLYGTTAFGGGAASGTVFRLSTDGTGYGILHRFTNSVSGAFPTARLMEGVDGRLYGTTETNGPAGQGVVFALGRDGSGFAILHAFTASAGSLRKPQGALVQDATGGLYGTAAAGGAAGLGASSKSIPMAPAFVCSTRSAPPGAMDARASGRTDLWAG
jgi:uncharacterized repeat protein (TIGR03803 family)